MKRIVALAIALTLIALSITSLAYFGVEPDVAYQSEHIGSGLTCEVTVFGSMKLLALEDRTDCGGALALVVPSNDFAADYLLCMAQPERPDLGTSEFETDSILWYTGYAYWDMAGRDCGTYLSMVHPVLRNKVASMGKLVRRSAVQQAAP